MTATTSVHSDTRSTVSREAPSSIARLSRIEGVWEGDALITRNGATVCFRLRHENTHVAGGWGFQIAEIGEIPGAGLYRSMDVFGYDASLDELHLYTVSNLGHAHAHQGRWTDDDHLVFEYEGTEGGAHVLETIPISLVSGNEYLFQYSSLVGEEISVIFEARMARVV